MPHTLTRHRDIQNWVAARQGTPAIARLRNGYGQERAQLRLRFASHRLPTPLDEQAATSPISWTAWLAELDRQQLALQIDDEADDFALVERRTTN
ncbi:hypothetical protein [Devosia aquimaris]|uniref:hypothetical protein n=1 Tax=Devosia aquimaris TaxID=2866214 RepID=UPI001CD11D5F|nr:hypothetical protein [Devosia sp. CJK-A8-3]